MLFIERVRIQKYDFIAEKGLEQRAKVMGNEIRKSRGHRRSFKVIKVLMAQEMRDSPATRQ